MILHAILKALLTVASWPLSLLSSLGVISFSWDWVDGFMDAMDVVFFIFPVYDLMPLFFLVFALTMIKITIALVKLILNLIPLY